MAKEVILCFDGDEAGAKATKSCAEELNKMRRRLGILQRTGGSASSIRSLQEQITQKEKDTYFDAQQQQINAIQDASDAEIERLDTQIQLMTETLEYQKEHGLLWNQVATIMQGTPEQINEFIVNNEKVWETYSTTKWNEEYRQLALQTAEWSTYRDWNEPYWKSVTGETANLNQQIQGYDTTKWQVYDAAMAEVIGGEKWATMRDKAKEYFLRELQKTEDPRKAAEEVEKIPEVKEAIEQMNPKDGGSSNVTKPVEPTKPSNGGGGNGGSDNKDKNDKGYLSIVPEEGLVTYIKYDDPDNCEVIMQDKGCVSNEDMADLKEFWNHIVSMTD